MKIPINYFIHYVVNQATGHIFEKSREIIFLVISVCSVLMLSSTFNPVMAQVPTTISKNTQIYDPISRQNVPAKLCLDNKWQPYMSYNDILFPDGFTVGQVRFVELLKCDDSESQKWLFDGTAIKHVSDNTCLTMNPKAAAVNIPAPDSLGPNNLRSVTGGIGGAVDEKSALSTFYTSPCNPENANQAFLIQGQRIVAINDTYSLSGAGVYDRTYPVPVCIASYIEDFYNQTGPPYDKLGPVALAKCARADFLSVLGFGGRGSKVAIAGYPTVAATGERMTDLTANDLWDFTPPGPPVLSKAGSATGCTLAFKPGRQFTFDLVAEDGIATKATFMVTDNQTGYCLKQGTYDVACNINDAGQRHDMNNNAVSEWVLANTRLNGSSAPKPTKLPPTPLYGTIPAHPGFWQPGVALACNAFSNITPTSGADVINNLAVLPATYLQENFQKIVVDSTTNLPPQTTTEFTQDQFFNLTYRNPAAGILERIDQAADRVNITEPSANIKYQNLNQGSRGIGRLAHEIGKVLFLNNDNFALDLLDSLGPVLFEAIDTMQPGEVTYSTWWRPGSPAATLRSGVVQRSASVGGLNTTLFSVQFRATFNANTVIRSETLGSDIKDLVKGNLRIVFPLVSYNRNTDKANLRNAMYNNSAASWTDNLFVFQVAAEIDFDVARTKIANSLNRSWMIPQPTVGAEVIFSISSRTGQRTGVVTRLDSIAVNVLGDLDAQGGVVSGVRSGTLEGMVGKFRAIQQKSRTFMLAERYRIQNPAAVDSGAATNLPAQLMAIVRRPINGSLGLMSRVLSIRKADDFSHPPNPNQFSNNIDAFNARLDALRGRDARFGTLKYTGAISVLGEVGLGFRWFNTSFLDEVECRNNRQASNLDTKPCGYTTNRIGWQANTVSNTADGGFAYPDVIFPYVMGQVTWQFNQTMPVTFARTNILLGTVAPRFQFNSVSGGWFAFSKRAAAAMTAGFTGL
jgi:hypothetical protein